MHKCARRRDGSDDGLVPGSAGKDSFHAAHVLKTGDGMDPLTVARARQIYAAWAEAGMPSLAGSFRQTRLRHRGHKSVTLTA
jgi:hypothetical protein